MDIIAEFWKRRGKSLENSKSFVRAEHAYRKALSSSANDYSTNLRLARILLKEERFDEALTFFDRAIEVRPNSPTAFFGRGRCLAALKQVPDAITALERAAALSENADYLAALAPLYKSQKKYWQEVDAIGRAVALQPQKSPYLFELADAQERMHDFEAAAASFEKLAAIKPTSENFYRLGYTLEKAGSHEKAQAAYDECVALSGTAELKRFGVGYLHQKNGLWPEAAAAYATTATKSPRDADLLYRTGFAFDRSYDWASAAHFFEMALFLTPENADWHFRMGFALERAERLDMASGAYEVAAADRLTHTPYWFYRWAQTLQSRERYKEAAGVYMLMDLQNYKRWKREKLFTNDVADPARHEHFARLKKNGLEKLLAFGLPEEEFPTNGSAADATDALSLQDVVARAPKFSPALYVELGKAHFRAGNYLEACLAFQETRRSAAPHGINVDVHVKNPGRQAVLHYNEMLNLPIQGKTIVYESFGGSSMSCNPYAIFKQLVDDPIFAGWTHVWSLDDEANAKKEYRDRDNVIFIPRDSDLYRRYLATASHLINNSTFPTWFIRRAGQRYLNTWHGTPLKTLGTKMRGRFQEHKNGARNFLQATHLITPNAHTTDVTINDFGLKGLIEHKIRETGYPRIDLMLNMSASARATLREKLVGDRKNQKIVLYAPTWRGTHGSVELDVEKLKMDIAAMDAAGCAVIFRGHAMMQKLLVETDLNAVVVPDDIDTNELLSAVDILVTDYSSIFFDFIPAQLPIIYYAYDMDEYLAERGMYFPLSKMPGIICRTVEDLQRAIGSSALVESPAGHPVAEFNQHDDGNATQRCVQFFFDEAAPVQVHDRKNILFFAGPFMPNGITAAFLSLVRGIDPEKYNIYLVIDPGAIEKAPERIELFERLPAHVQVIARCGTVSQTFEERWIDGRIEAHEGEAPAEMLAIHATGMRREFKRMFGDIKFDSIVNFEGYQRFWAKLLAEGNAKRRTIFLHNDMYEEWRTKLPELRHLFFVYNSYDELLSVSEDMSTRNAESLSERFGIPKSHFAACQNVIDVKQILERSGHPLDPDLKEWFSADLTTFVNIGRLSPEKDQEKLIRAFAKTQQKHSSSRLVIVGDGPLREYLRGVVGECGLQDRVLLAGLRANALPIMKAGACFVLSSNHEGQPIVLLEALTLGKEIIATDITGNRGVLDGTPAHLVKNTRSGLEKAMNLFIEQGLSKPSFDAEAYSQRAVKRFLQLV